MSDLVVVENDVDLELWLDEVAGRVQHHLGSAAYEIYQAGYWLAEARDRLNTQAAFVKWVDEKFSFSRGTAERYIRVTKMLDDLIPKENIPKLVAGKSVLYGLASSVTPGPVRDEMLAKLEQGQRVTLGMVKAAASGAIRAEGQRAAVLETGSERIELLNNDLDMDPEVISMLGVLESSKPEVFEEIYASGCVWDAQGESIPLESANSRDVQAYIDHNRFEKQAQGLSEIGAIKLVLDKVKPPSQRVVYSAYGLAQKAYIDTAMTEVKMAIAAQLGEDIYAFDQMVDVVYTIYQTNAPYKPSEVWVAGYETGLYEAGLIKATGPFHISSVKVRVKLVNQNPRVVIDLYPREELFS